MENGIFSRSGKHSTKVKWEKNGFRTAVVIGCAGIAWAGASDLDKFVSLIGSLACVPLCFCYRTLHSHFGGSVEHTNDSLILCSRITSLQSLRTHSQAKDPRYFVTRFRTRRSRLHHFANCRSRASPSRLK